MRILALAIGSDGDINPMLEISRELKLRGHEVIFYANGYFKERVEQENIRLIELGDSDLYHMILRKPELWSPNKGFQAIWDELKHYLLEQYQKLADMVIPGETALVGTTMAFSARMLQEKHGIKLTTLHLQPSVILSAELPPSLPGVKISTKLPLIFRKLIMQLIDEQILDRVVKCDINKARADLGLAPTKNIMGRWIHSPDRVLLAFPEWFGTAQRDWPVNHQYTGFPIFSSKIGKSISADAQKFIDDGEPPLIFTAGSANAHSRQFFDTAYKALKHMGERAIFVSKFQELSDMQLPGSIHVSTYEPFDLLFPRSRAVVHHGGIGTTAQCLWAGVPQMIFPFAHDQFDNADRIEALNLGLYARSGNVVEWVKKLGSITGKSIYSENSRARARQMQVEENAASKAATAIEKLGV